ncbi:hypothetical protein GCM10017788_36560 [Amycolatopsis acidiphila]|nr:hypothetical protein GCM10017788_36560 [Amycolatopsis acidiphila]
MQQWLGFSLGTVLSACMIAVAAEGAYSTAVFKTWAGPHHRFRKALLADVKIIIGSALTTWTVATGYYYFIAGQFGGFKKYPANADWFDRLVYSLRFSWTSLVAQGDADPDSDAANAATLVIQITGASYVLILLGLFGGMLLEANRREFETEESLLAENTSGDSAENDVAVAEREGRRVKGMLGVAAAGYFVWRFWHGI